MALPSSAEWLAPDEFWKRTRSAFERKYPGLSSGEPAPNTPARAKEIRRLIGTVNGRGWEVAFYGGRAFAPETILGLSTSVRLLPLDHAQVETVPWYYAGPRPRVFSRAFLDYDRIIMRYRRRESHMKGAQVGDPTFDRRWAVYPFDPVLGDALRDPDLRQFFESAAALGPRKAESPTIAIFGLEAILSVTVELRSDIANSSASLLARFSAFLDRLETLRALAPASQAPIAVDYLPDESDLLYPVPRIHCPSCGADSHPRYMPHLETEVCDRCRISLYLIRGRE